MIGLITDTHDNIPGIVEAVKIFKRHHCNLVLHAGDIVSPATILYFDGLNMKFVKGNCDGDIENIAKKTREIGGEYLGEFAHLRIDGKDIALVHGHKKDGHYRLQDLIEHHHYDYIIIGHTHKKRDETFGSTRVINSGGLYLGSNNCSIALFDPKKDYLKFFDIKV